MSLPANPISQFSQLLRLIAVLALLALGFMFSMVIFAVIAVVGLIAYGYLRWKTRHLRKAMQAARQQPSQPMPGGDIIEGEAVVVEEFSVRDSRALNKP